MTGLFDPKFNVHEEYSRDEFIDRFEVFIAGGGDQDFIKNLERQLAWAQRLPDNAIIRFEIRGTTVFPVATYPL